MAWSKEYTQTMVLNKYRNNDQNTAAIQKQEYQGTLLTTTVLQQRKPEDQYIHEVWSDIVQLHGSNHI
jgi:hypothetical protein